jgi:dTDP-glucose pyrophosphorylase
MADLTPFLISPERSVREAMACIDRNTKGVALVVDANRKLLGTVTDGDIRRALLADVDLGLPVSMLLKRKAAEGFATPVTAAPGSADVERLAIMTRHEVRHLPIVDSDGVLVHLTLLSDVVKELQLPVRALVMAGGYGTRLRPLTAEVPKSMLPVGDRPLLEHIVRQLQQAGIRRVNLATHYRADVIEQHFGDGRDFEVDIQYVNEDRPLGTAGAVSLMARSDEPLLVINGDILTRVDFPAMVDFHRANKADMTVAVRAYDVQIPFGVVETDGVLITGVYEKPFIHHFVNAGIYLLNGDVCGLLPAGQAYHMTDLIAHLIAEQRRVISFPIREYWVDIGQREDYERALSDAGHTQGGTS